MNPAIVMLILRVLLALLLYAFLALLLIFLWRDLRGRNQASAMTPDAHLLVEAGPEPGQTFRLADSNTIGRSAENEVGLPDDTVSAKHASIKFRKGMWWLEDLGSKNGTTLNQKPVEQPVVITSGDTIGFGRARLVFNSGLPEDD